MHTENFRICSITCTDCGEVFKQKDKLLNHTKLKHPTMNVEDDETKEGNTVIDDNHQIKRLMWRCHCGVEFQRRGMIVNHILRLHPDMSLISACSALQEPLLKPVARFHCPCCCKVYRSRTKRKHHIMRNHPGYSFPPKVRVTKEKDPLTSFSGTVAVSVWKCSVADCQKQFSTRAKLIQHVRNKHQFMDCPVYNDPLLMRKDYGWERDSNYIDTVITRNIFSCKEEALQHQEMIQQIFPYQPSLTTSTSNMLYTPTTKNNLIPCDGMLYEHHALPDSNLNLGSNLSVSNEIISHNAEISLHNDINSELVTMDPNKEKISFSSSYERIMVSDKNCNRIEDSECNSLELVEDYLVENAGFNLATSFDISLSLNDDLNKDSDMIENMESLIWSDNKSGEPYSAPVESFADSTDPTKCTLEEAQIDISHRYNCHVCGMSFTRKFALKHHNMSRHADPKVKNYYPEKTLKRPSKGKIKRQRKHIFNKDKEIFTSSTNIKDMEKRKKKSSLSDTRGEVFSVKNDFSILKEVHTLRNSPATQQNIDNRFKSDTKASQPHPCALCPSSFPNKHKLNLHMLRHSDHRQFSCPVCKQQFKRKDKYSRHMKLKHSVKVEDKKTKPQSSKSNEPKSRSGDWLCHCGVSFKRRGMIVNHIWRKHPTMTPSVACPTLHRPLLRPDTRFHCPHCTKVYCSRTKRKLHILKNHPGCALPPNARNSGKGEIDTLTTHAGKVAINISLCPIESCYKQYASHAKLAQHIRRKHPDHCSLAVKKISNKYATENPDVQLPFNSPLDDSNHFKVELFSQDDANLDDEYSIEITQNVIFVQGVDISLTQTSLENLR